MIDVHAKCWEEETRKVLGGSGSTQCESEKTSTENSMKKKGIIEKTDKARVEVISSVRRRKKEKLCLGLYILLVLVIIGVIVGLLLGGDAATTGIILKCTRCIRCASMYSMFFMLYMYHMESVYINSHLKVQVSI